MGNATSFAEKVAVGLINSGQLPAEKKDLIVSVASAYLQDGEQILRRQDRIRAPWDNRSKKGAAVWLEKYVAERTLNKVRAIVATEAVDPNEKLRHVDSMFPLVSPVTLRHTLSKSNFVVAADDLASRPSSGWFASSPLRKREQLRDEDLFKAQDYMEQCQALLLDTFPMLWRSQVQSVLAEYNFCYGQCIGVLRDLDARRSAGFFDWITRPEQNRPVTNPQLARDILRVNEKDNEHSARQLNRAQYEECEEGLECECCFVTSAAEDVTSCGAGHVICLECVRSFVGNLGRGDVGYQVMEENRGAVRCFAACAERCRAPVA